MHGVGQSCADAGGWDTHVNQGNAQGQLANLLREMGQSLAAFHADMGDRMDQVAVRNHGMMGRFFKFSGRVILGSAPLVLRCMLQKFGGFQVMINALLRHLFRLTKSHRQLGKVVGAGASP